MLYRYRAFDPAGQVVQGEVEAARREEALERLRSRGLLVDFVRPVLRLRFSWNMELGAPKLTLRQIALLFNLLAMLISGGVPILQALQVLANTSSGPLKLILQRMVRDVEAGAPLSQALANQGKVFPRMALQIVYVAEVSGELDSSLRLLSQQFESEDLMRRKFKSAMIYPVIVLAMALGLAVFMMLFIVPSFAEMFRDLGAELPWQTRAMLAVADFMTDSFHIIAAFAVAGVGGFRYGMARSHGFRLLVHRLVLKVKVFGPLIWHRETAQYTRTLGTMVKSGVPVVTAAEVATGPLENAWLAHLLRTVPESIANGATLGQAVKASGAIPVLFAELLTVGEMIGASDETLERVAALCDADVKQTLERLTTILEPVLIMLLGAIVLCVIVPLLLPMFDLYGKIK